MPSRPVAVARAGRTLPCRAGKAVLVLAAVPDGALRGETLDRSAAEVAVGAFRRARITAEVTI